MRMEYQFILKSNSCSTKALNLIAAKKENKIILYGNPKIYVTGFF
jgi:hypothetical protein